MGVCILLRGTRVPRLFVCDTVFDNLHIFSQLSVIYYLLFSILICYLLFVIYYYLVICYL